MATSCVLMGWAKISRNAQRLACSLSVLTGQSAVRMTALVAMPVDSYRERAWAAMERCWASARSRRENSEARSTAVSPSGITTEKKPCPDPVMMPTAPACLCGDTTARQWVRSPRLMRSRSVTPRRRGLEWEADFEGAGAEESWRRLGSIWRWVMAHRSWAAAREMAAARLREFEEVMFCACA
jgi:hypothetical protein